MSYPALTLDRLQNIINSGGIDDDDIAQGVQFSPTGYQKLAAKMGVRLNEIRNMVNELIQKVRNENSTDSEDEFAITEDVGDEYTFEADILGNMTVRNTKTGEESYVQGSEAAELKQALDHHPDNAQDILAQYMEEAEPVMEDDEEGEHSYEAELDDTKGTYNFPWKYGTKHGTATVEYFKKGDKPVFNVISIRNASGDEIRPLPALEIEVKKQAEAFIGDA